MHYQRTIVSLAFPAAVFFFPFIAFAANPTTTITPLLNVQDPGALTAAQQIALSVASCGPLDSNCYIDSSGSPAVIAATSITNTGNTALGDSAADTTTITGILDLLSAKIKGALALVFEGARSKRKCNTLMSRVLAWERAIII